MHYETAAVIPSSLGSCGFVQYSSLPLGSLPSHCTNANLIAWVFDSHRKQHTLNCHIRVPGEITPHSAVYPAVPCANEADSCFCVTVFFNTVCHSFLFPCPQTVADAQPKCAPASKDVSHSPRSRLRRSLSTYSLTSVFVSSGRQSTPVTTPVVSDYS